MLFVKNKIAYTPFISLSTDFFLSQDSRLVDTYLWSRKSASKGSTAADQTQNLVNTRIPRTSASCARYFDSFLKTAKNGLWRALVYRLGTSGNSRNTVLHQYNLVCFYSENTQLEACL